MSAGGSRRAIVVGAGTRARETVLPVLLRMDPAIVLHGVFARGARGLDVEGRRLEVRALNDLTRDEARGVDLIVLAVTKDAVPKVLRALLEKGLGAAEILVDTPVVQFRHLHHAALLGRFRRASVAEDCVTLPCFDPLRKAIEDGVLGDARCVRFDRSAWKYHGLALVKDLLGAPVERARRAAQPDGSVVRTLKMRNGTEAVIVEPRDYAAGRFTWIGTGGSAGDGPAAAPMHLALAPVLAAGRVRGFAAGPIETALDADEAGLLGPPAVTGAVVPLMEDMKRVGLLRLYRRLAAGVPAYPVREALDDMVVDYLIDKVGRYRATPFSSVRAGPGRFLLSLATRVAARGR